MHPPNRWRRSQIARARLVLRDMEEDPGLTCTDACVRNHFQLSAFLRMIKLPKHREIGMEYAMIVSTRSTIPTTPPPSTFHPRGSMDGNLDYSRWPRRRL